MDEVGHHFLVLLLGRLDWVRNSRRPLVAQERWSTRRVSQILRVHHIELLLEISRLMAYLWTLMKEPNWRHMLRLLMPYYKRCLVIHKWRVVAAPASDTNMWIWSLTLLLRQVGHWVVPPLLQRRNTIRPIVIVENWSVLLWTGIQLLQAAKIVLIVLLQIDDNQRYVIPTVIVCTTFFGYLFGDLGERVQVLAPHLVYLLGQLFLAVNEEETVWRQDKQIVIFLDLVVKALGIGNYEFFVWSIANGTAHRDRAVHPRHPVSIGNQSIYVKYAGNLVLPVRILVHSYLVHLSVSFHQKSARVANVT